MKQRYYEKGGGRGDKKRCLCLLFLHIASKLLHTKHPPPPQKTKRGRKKEIQGIKVGGAPQLKQATGTKKERQKNGREMIIKGLGLGESMVYCAAMSQFM